jgi:hypothetical protein
LKGSSYGVDEGNCHIISQMNLKRKNSGYPVSGLRFKPRPRIRDSMYGRERESFLPLGLIKSPNQWVSEDLSGDKEVAGYPLPLHHINQLNTETTLPFPAPPFFFYLFLGVG